MASNRTDIICRSDEVDIRKIDEGMKNIWKWSWLEREVKETYLHESIRKIYKTGVAYCLVCQKEIVYGSRGFIALADHVKSDKHATGLQQRKQNTAIPGNQILIFIANLV